MDENGYGFTVGDIYFIGTDFYGDTGPLNGNGNAPSIEYCKQLDLRFELVEDHHVDDMKAGQTVVFLGYANKPKYNPAIYDFTIGKMYEIMPDNKHITPSDNDGDAPSKKYCASVLRFGLFGVVPAEADYVAYRDIKPDQEYMFMGRKPRTDENAMWVDDMYEYEYEIGKVYKTPTEFESHLWMTPTDENGENPSSGHYSNRLLFIKAPVESYTEIIEDSEVSLDQMMKNVVSYRQQVEIFTDLVEREEEAINRRMTQLGYNR